MTYTPILNAEVDAESPVTDLLLTRLRDNPIAIAAGNVGAPRIADAALGPTATNEGRDWVLGRAALAVEGAIGTYVFAYGTGTYVAFGSTVAGSTLRPTSAARSISVGSGSATFDVGSTLSGTWRCMGTFDLIKVQDSITVVGATLWLRIS